MILTAACVQLRAGTEPTGNADMAEALVRRAAGAGATYVQTPEMTNVLQPHRAALLAVLREEAEDPTLARMRALAAELGIHLHVGSLAIRVDADRAANRSFLIGPDGAILARYDKIHMFDVDLGEGSVYRESRTYRPGNSAVYADMGEVRLGLTICYDMRFPALYRALAQAGCALFAVPSSFTRPTGLAHWEVLLRARAIETGGFVLAAAQGGRHEGGRETWGHSLIVGPWGEVVASLDHDEPDVLVADLDLDLVADARARIPSLGHDRNFSIGKIDPARRVS